MDRDSWVILDNLFNQTDLPGEPYFGENEDTLATQVDVDNQAAANLRKVSKEFKPHLVALPDVEKVNPPNITRLRAEQLLDIKRSPTDWACKHVTLLEIPQQLVGYRPGRKSVVITNCSANVLIGSSRLDLLENEAGTGPITNKYITVYSSGSSESASVSIETEGPIWANAALGTTCEIFENFWDMNREQNAETIAKRLED